MLIRQGTTEPRPKRPYRLARLAGAAGLLVIGAVSAVNSWASLYTAFAWHLGDKLPSVAVGGARYNTGAASASLLLDALIVVASIKYVIGVKEKRKVAGWRTIAHAAIAATVLMNAGAATRLADIPWHMIAPAVLSIVVELVARDILGELREIRIRQTDRIPLRLWLTAPGESVRTSWRMARTGQRCTDAARVESDRCAAAGDALKRVYPGREHRRMRRKVMRRLWAGTVAPWVIFEAIGWTVEGIVTPPPDPQDVLRVALRGVLPGDTQGTRKAATAGTRTSATRVTAGDIRGGHAGDIQEATAGDTALSAEGTRQGDTPQVTADVPAALSESERTVMAYLLDGQKRTRKEVIDGTGLKVTTAKSALAKLRIKGYVTALGEGMYASTAGDIEGDADTATEGTPGDTDDVAGAAGGEL